MKNFIYPIIVMMALSCTLKAQDLPVYWLHGFQSSPIPTTDQFPGRWDLYSTKYQKEKQIKSYVPNYARNVAEVSNGIANAANVLAGRMTNHSKSVLISHSMGGLVARKIDANNSRTIGGIVSVGTVHNGALIATNLQNGKVLKSAKKGFDELVKGPASTLISVIYPFGIGKLQANDIANLLWDNVLESFMMDQLPPTNSATLRDLMPNSTFLNDLNSRSTKVPFINVIISEEDHEALRMAASAMAQPETQPLHSHDDNEYNQARISTKSWYKAFKDYYLALRWIQLWRFNSLTTKADYYKAGESYLDHGFEIDYNQLNGSLSYEYITSTRQVWKCNTSSSGYRTSSKSAMMTLDPLPSLNGCLTEDIESDCIDCRWVYETYSTNNTLKYAQDGLATIKAQDTKIAQYTDFRAYSVNHMEVGNNIEMTRIFDEIFALGGTDFYRKKR